LGGVETVDFVAGGDDPCVDAERSAGADRNQRRLVRLSVGIEDVEDIVADLDSGVVIRVSGWAARDVGGSKSARLGRRGPLQPDSATRGN